MIRIPRSFHIPIALKTEFSAEIWDLGNDEKGGIDDFKWWFSFFDRMARIDYVISSFGILDWQNIVFSNLVITISYIFAIISIVVILFDAFMVMFLRV